MTEPLRIGTTERHAALSALDEHLAAGRLGIEEYADRSATAANAVLAAELRALFTDLPPPYPELPERVVLPAARAQSPQPARKGSALGPWGPRIMVAVLLVVVVLYVLTRTWFWFLLIPVVAVLVYRGGRGRSR